MKLYLVGPMSGIPQFNYPAFIDGKVFLEGLGFEVQSPTDLDDEATFAAAMASPDGNIEQPVNGVDYETFVAKSIARILTWRPDALVALPGWERSSGTAKEIAVANGLGIPTYTLASYETWAQDLMPTLPEPHEHPAADELTQLALHDADGRFVLHEENPLRQRAVTGAVKDNRGKANVELLPTKPLLAVGRVLGFGARKYKPNNWRLGLSWSQTLGSSLRHIFAFMDGEDMDPESGEMHIDNAICQLMFLSEYWHTKTGEDDRWATQSDEAKEASKA